MEYVIYTLLAYLLLMVAARLWNEVNLDSRQYHREMAEFYLKTNKVDLAWSHYERARKLQGWFIRFI